KTSYSLSPRSLCIIFCIIVIMLTGIRCSETFNDTRLPALGLPDVRIIDGRMALENSSSFFDLISSISEMQEPDLAEWVRRKNFPSLFESVDTLNVDSLSLKRLPFSYQAVLNKDGEVLIGDTIVWYSPTGIKHYIPNSDNHALSEIKQGQRKSEITQTYAITRIPTESNRMNGSGRFGFNGEIDARWQHEFCYQNRYIVVLGQEICTARRKYVNELYNFVDGSWHTLYLRIKLEWYGNHSHQWQVAGENRIISYNFSY